MNDREPGERAHLDLLHDTPHARSTVEAPYTSLHVEARENIDEARQRLSVGERDAPVRGWEAETVAPPAGLVAERSITERHPGEVADTVVVVEVFGDDRHVAKPATLAELPCLRPTEIPGLQPAMFGRRDDFRSLGHQPHSRTPRPPNRLDHRRPELPRPSWLRELVETKKNVTDSQIADRSPHHVGVQDRRIRHLAVRAAVLATSVRIQTEPEPDVRTLVLREHRPARVAVEERRPFAGVAIHVDVRIRVQLDVERLVAVRRVRARPAAGQIGTHRAQFRLFSAPPQVGRLRHADELQRVDGPRPASARGRPRAEAEHAGTAAARRDPDRDRRRAPLVRIESRTERHAAGAHRRRRESSDGGDEPVRGAARRWRDERPALDRRPPARLAAGREARVVAIEADGDRERAAADRRVGVAAGVAVLAPLPDGRLAVDAGPADRVHDLPLRQALRARRTAARDEERRRAVPGREPALVAAGERPARESERLARAAAEVRAVALLVAVDRAVAAGGALAHVEVTLVAP